MRIWRVTFLPEQDSDRELFWFSNKQAAKAKAAKLRQNFVDLEIEIYIDPINVPTKRADLVNWFNTNFKG